MTNFITQLPSYIIILAVGVLALVVVRYDITLSMIETVFSWLQWLANSEKYGLIFSMVFYLVTIALVLALATLANRKGWINLVDDIPEELQTAGLLEERITQYKLNNVEATEVFRILKKEKRAYNVTNKELKMAIAYVYVLDDQGKGAQKIWGPRDN